MIVVVPAVAGAWAMAGPGVVVGLLTASGTVSGVGVERVGAVVGSRGSVVTSTWCIVPVGLPLKAYPAHSI